MNRERLQLYGAELSYFTGKVRAYLRWKGLPFDEVAASAAVYRDVIVPRVGFPVIPIVVTPEDETLQDSTDIIEELERRHGEPSVQPSSPVQRLVAVLLELYGDEWLLIPAMHYRWCHNREWAIRAFGELSAPDAAPEEQVAIGERRSAPFANAAVLLGVAPHMHGAIEASYEALLGELDRHFFAHAYVLGDRPCVGDFGLVGPLYAHQYRDPASGELMRRRAPHVARWVERMQRPPAPRSGDFLGDDRIPSSLLPVLTRMMREQMPVLTDTSRLFREWLIEHPEQRVPRAIGTHDYELEGQRGPRIVRPYGLWMLQRARDVYVQLSGADRSAADRLLEAVGGEQFAAFEDGPRLLRDGMSVRLEATSRG